MKFSNCLSLIVLSLMVLSAYADEDESTISCYVCNSNTDASCDDDYTPKDSHKEECTNSETHCRKTLQSVHGENSIVRQCAKELKVGSEESCYKTSGKSTQTVCSCKSVNGEPCNTGVSAKSSLGAVVLSVAIAKIFF